MYIVLLVIYLLGVYAFPYWLDFVEDNDEWTRLLFPWIWPICLVVMVFGFLLYTPEIFRGIVRDYKNDRK